MAKIIDGKAIAKKLRAVVKAQTEQLKQKGVIPGLVVILIGNDPASEIYVRNKERAAEKVGVNARTIKYPASATEAEVLAKIEALNQDEQVDAILVQSPMPAQFNSEVIQAAISPAKDVDGFHPLNIGKLFANRSGYYPVANTPRGIMTMLKHEGVALAGKNILVVGRSILVGRPMFALLERANATVTLAHRYTPIDTLKLLAQQADVVIVATGVVNLIQGSDLKAGAVVIDVGINRLADGKLVGDVDFSSASQVASAITPVPGGVGPMTIATLLQTTVELAGQHHDIEMEQAWQNI
ncbi:methenyltetrahydrofolate cyclohydrolase [Weissella oryzae SG25]|uniref:Bifunctional protein FolD n=1 Tax=Weissella oryzae (strain DSM 25784 / JCM 18191 / LMG 30913 / SG25) TaxID=1329250 RepID=A0A069D217_WEIOS|nr:tetrahydrofolate dehydrogenase/cyclohydrolase catalytic domain-containing protein [Weissella oryzae]GAK31421.1 methenyltetrahydrofolate cyclohydrolase [Weissella oryzae SG25]